MLPFVRVYATAVAGLPLSMKFERAARTFALSFAPDGSIAAPSVIAVPRVLYPEGFSVSCTPSSAVVQLGVDAVQVHNPPGGGSATVHVSIVPKAA